MDTWNKALEIVDAALTFGIHPSLEPITRVCKLLDNPQESYRCIQVAGTNGKSSTTRYLASLLRAEGFCVGLYTSPELISITDRIEIQGVPVDEEAFARAVIHVDEIARNDGLELTEFELITAVALLLFKEFGVEYAVLEVGLGGRWDATSVVHPELAILTGVDLDHTAVLGTTIGEIAAEKAAIIKEGTIALAAPTHQEALEIFKQQAKEQQAPWFEVDAAPREELSYQAQNKLTALTALRTVLTSTTLSNEQAYQIMGSTVIPGRLEILQKDPFLLIDAAHNPASAHLLAQTLRIPNATLLLGVLSDKDAEGIIDALAGHFARIAVTQTDNPRAIPATELALLVEKCTGIVPRVFATPAEALDTILQEPYPVVATGSITLAGAVKREILAGRRQL